ncbi:MAG: OmpA family protein [Rhodobacterales bacterium]|nr:OmpA family protein [Rhodobacterales bacterium]
MNFAYDQALKALEISTPCGGVDRDRDTIPDIVDSCPDEPEDFDGDRDNDGCRDIDPYGDEDGDGIINMEDGCIDEPEDFDGHNDEDGCPESSDDSDGDGIIDAVDQCPDDAEDPDGFEDANGCPDLDNDQDGVADFRDGCPMVAEDPDDWDDYDGCPDPDNDFDGIADINDECPNEPGERARNGCPTDDRDADGIADANDACPDVPETRNNYLDEDGCPDSAPTLVKVTRTMVEIRETIQFETGSATLKAESFKVLDEVVTVLKDVPDMRMRVEGHTDSQGGDDFNMKLSQERANSVRIYLESKGTAGSRLTSKGHGETRPIDTNRTPDGRAMNRRVEFHIVKD